MPDSLCRALAALLPPDAGAGWADPRKAHALWPGEGVARATATVLFYVYRGTYLTLRPLLEDRTLEALATGTRLPPRDLLRNALQQGLVLPLLLALLSTAVLRKREWAIPSGN